MSQKIPFLQMFAALRQWTELSNGVEGWLIVSAAIDKASRSAKIQVEGAAGAGPNLVAQAEEAVGRAYGLNSVWIEALPSAPKEPEAAAQTPAPEAPEEPHEAGQSGSGVAQRGGGRELLPPGGREGGEGFGSDDPFARTEAIRRAAMKNAVRASSAPAQKDKKPQGKAIYGKAVTKAPVPIGELELDMGTVVVDRKSVV